MYKRQGSKLIGTSSAGMGQSRGGGIGGFWDRQSQGTKYGLIAGASALGTLALSKIFAGDEGDEIDIENKYGGPVYYRNYYR